jgi:hypothetical protein
MTTKMSLLSPPSLGEALLYLRHNGVRRSIRKVVSGYIAGRQQWHMTREDLSKYVGLPVDAEGLEFRFARHDDVPRMRHFTQRMSAPILRLWCGPDYYFFLTLKDGVAISYRCLSTLIHPGVVGFVRLRSDQIFMVDEFTVPAFRRRGVTRQMAIAMTPLLMRRGFREVLGIHRVDNADTIAAARAKGIPRIGTITRTCVLWKTWFSYSVAPEVGTAANLGEDNVAVAATRLREPMPARLEKPLAGHEAV